MISLPDALLQEVDGLAADGHRNRSELIREAMGLYLLEVKRQRLHERMKQGYLEMAELNLSLAEEALIAENQAGAQLTGGRLVLTGQKI